jgi:16S rRNA (cytosine1402-N4)-methyltransferase
MREGQHWATEYHAHVLVREVLSFLGGRKRVLDCTGGGGGHSEALLVRGAVQHVVGIDRDPTAIEVARARLAQFEDEGRFSSRLANYAEVHDEPLGTGLSFDGVLLDLGIS